MAAERLSMRKIKEVLRLHAAGQSQRAIAHSVAIARSTVKEYLQRAAAAGVVWPVPADMTESALEARLFPAPISFAGPRPLPDYRVIYDELKDKRRNGVTLQLLWLEYKETNPDGCSTVSSASAIVAGAVVSIACCVRSTRPATRCC